MVEGELLAGKYRVERVLARGGMGVVCAAIHTQLEQRVALKFLLPEGESNEHSRLRFLREARAAVRLRSEHVARVLDVGTAEEGAPYIVMEYLEGQDLGDVLAERGQLPVDEAVRYVLQAAEAVAEAHALGIIHRDLKPANLFLTRRPDGSPCVKVLDFGISKTLGGTPNAGGLTQASAMIGTPHYMSPEQIRSSKSVDVRSDIWAMGMILYEFLTGVVAFPRETLPELCSAIILDPLPSPRIAVPHLSEELERAITMTLAKAPENRPQSLAELALLLAPFTPDGHEAAARVARVLKIDVEAMPSSQRMLAATSSDPIVAARASSPELSDVVAPAIGGATAEPPPDRERDVLASEARPATLASTPLASSEASEAGEAEPDAPLPGADRRRRSRLAVAAVGGVLVLVLAAAALMTRGAKEADAVRASSGSASAVARVPPQEKVDTAPSPPAPSPAAVPPPIAPEEPAVVAAPSASAVAAPRAAARAGTSPIRTKAARPDDFGPRR